MKCPHCNYEREQDFNFCPLCGWRINEEAPIPNYPPQPIPVPVYQKKIPYGLTEVTYNERKQIKRHARIAGGAFLTLLGIAGILATVIFYVLYFIGFEPEKAYNLMQDPYVKQILQISISSFMFIVPFTLFYKCSKHKISKLIDFSLPKTSAWFPIVLMGIGFCAFANIANSIAASFFAGMGVNYEVDFGENPKGIFGITLSVIATAIVPALVEEFACRGLVLGSLRKYGDGFAVMVSSILFGLIHGNFQQIPFAFMVGLILGFITIKCESIWPAMLIHFYNNLSSVIFDYAFEGVEVIIQNAIYTVYLAICLLIGLVGVLLLRKYDGIFKFAPSNTEASEKQKYKWFFTTETVIIMVAICLIDSLQYFK